MELNVQALLSSGLLSPAQVEEALRASACDGAPLWRHLREAAAISDEELCDVIARVADLARCRPADLRAIDMEALTAVPAELCRALCVIPVRVDTWGALVVAMADPFDEGARAEVEFAARRPLRVELATERTVREAIERLHGDPVEEETQFVYDEDDLCDLFAAAVVDEADILEIVEVSLTAEEPSGCRAVG